MRSSPRPIPLARSDREEKGRAFPGFAFGPNSSSVAGDDPLDRRQPDAETFEILARGEPFKGSEKIRGVCHVEAYAIVLDHEYLFGARVRLVEDDRWVFAHGG